MSYVLAGSTALFVLACCLLLGAFLSRRVELRRHRQLCNRLRRDGFANRNLGFADKSVTQASIPDFQPTIDHAYLASRLRTYAAACERQIEFRKRNRIGDQHLHDERAVFGEAKCGEPTASSSESESGQGTTPPDGSCIDLFADTI